MSWVNEDACLQVLEAGSASRMISGTGGLVPRCRRPGAEHQSRETRGRKSALCALSHGLPEKEQLSARLPGAPHLSCRRPEKKRASVRSRNSKALLQAQGLTGEGGRDTKLRFNSVGSQAVGAPQDKRASVLERRQPPGPGGSIKGSCVPNSTQVHLCLLSPSRRKGTEGARRLTSLLRDPMIRMAKLFLQDAGNSDENSNELAC